MKKLVFIFLGCIFSLTNCNSLEKKKNLKTAQEFFEAYADRKDLKKLMNFYSNLNPEWEDAVVQYVLEGKESIENRYKDTWSYKDYKNLKTLEINEILSNDSVVVANGKYNPYYYNGNRINEMKFTTWLYFDKDGKIKKQVEWIQYSINDLKDIINFSQNTEIH